MLVSVKTGYQRLNDSRKERVYKVPKRQHHPRPLHSKQLDETKNRTRKPVFMERKNQSEQMGQAAVSLTSEPQFVNSFTTSEKPVLATLATQIGSSSTYTSLDLAVWYGSYRTRYGNFVWGYTKKPHRGLGDWSYLGYQNFYTQKGLSALQIGDFVIAFVPSIVENSVTENKSTDYKPVLLPMSEVISLNTLVGNTSSVAISSDKNPKTSALPFLPKVYLPNIAKISPIILRRISLTPAFQTDSKVAGHSNWNEWLRFIPLPKLVALLIKYSIPKEEAAKNTSSKSSLSTPILLSEILLNAHLQAVLAGRAHNIFADLHYTNGDHTAHDVNTQFHATFAEEQIEVCAAKEEEREIDHAIHQWLAGIHRYAETWIHFVESHSLDSDLHFEGGSHHNWYSNVLEVFLWFHGHEAGSHDYNHEGHSFEDWFRWWHTDMLHDQVWQGDHSFLRHGWHDGKVDLWWHYRETANDNHKDLKPEKATNKLKVANTH